MPTYDYKCDSCGYVWQREQRMSDKPIKTCPQCKQRKLERVIGPGALHDALAAKTTELTFLHARTDPRADRKLPRPTIKPPEVAERLRGWMRAKR